MSLLFGLLCPISELWYLQDYLTPQIFFGFAVGAEDFLFGFFSGGIASVLYEEILGKHLKRKFSEVFFPFGCYFHI